MNFIARAMAEKPYIYWENTSEPLTNQLVREQESIPENVFGICPWKIEGDKLEERTEVEMDAAEAEFNLAAKVSAQLAQINAVDNGTFTFGANDFPMNQTARLRYAAIESIGGDNDVMDASGTTVSILTADLVDFMTAYYTKLKDLTQPAV
ncbi:MAG: hypothetical protein ITG00_00130 [Flavobacterium sp.]|nr:hypothetical protein [Flavobacterium sp.]